METVNAPARRRALASIQAAMVAGGWTAAQAGMVVASGFSEHSDEEVIEQAAIVAALGKLAPAERREIADRALRQIRSRGAS